MKLYFDSLTTLKVIHAESPIVIFFGTYGIATTNWCSSAKFEVPLHTIVRLNCGIKVVNSSG